MLCFWAAKGGVGTSVLTTAVALALADAGERTLLVDLAGDLPTVLGRARSGDGIAEWAAGGDTVPADALDRLRQPCGPRLALLERGSGALDPRRARALRALLAARPERVVVDAGTSPSAFALDLLAGAERSILVTTTCYLAVDRGRALADHATDAVVHREADRAIRPDDVAAVLGLPVRAVVAHDPAVARAVDAGLLEARLPRRLRRAAAELAA